MTWVSMLQNISRWAYITTASFFPPILTILKDLVPMYVRTLTDPFFDTHVGCLMAAADALASCMVNCWPRIQGRYDIEIVRATAHCWLNIHNGGLAGPESDVRRLEDALKRIVLLASPGRDD